MCQARARQANHQKTQSTGLLNWIDTSCHKLKTFYFTTLDLAHAYLQIPLDEESKKYVVINTHRGLYHYNWLIKSLKSPPKAQGEEDAYMLFHVDSNCVASTLCGHGG